MSTSWNTIDFALAMRAAIESNASPRSLRCMNNKVLFNGFWRNGNKQNVCFWQDKASWHDAKTGDGGGCKEFAKIAFNMTLPEFMNRFQQGFHKQLKSVPNFANTKIATSADAIWQQLVAKKQFNNTGLEWLKNIRGFKKAEKAIGSGFATITINDLYIFNNHHQLYLKKRLSLGPNLVVPIRNVHYLVPQNLFFRAITPVPKEDKSRLLAGAGGFSDKDGSPRAFGFPSLINEFPILVICEGLADYLAMECTLYGEEKYLALGALNASSLKNWAQYLIQKEYSGKVVWVYQLDKNEEGQIASLAVGQKCATEASKYLKTAGIKSELFNWPACLKKTHSLPKIPDDFADLYYLLQDNPNLITDIFLSLH